MSDSVETKRNGGSLIDRVQAEIAVEQSTREFLEQLEKRVALQLKPIEDRQAEILTEIREHRNQVHNIERQIDVLKHRMEELEEDLTQGLRSVRDKWRIWASVIIAVTTLLTAVVMRLIQAGFG